ncbi:MAG: helix-turn-helix domain-containing protein [Burkholderiaceae bacterium]|nr:helix-turn-helix domain-containing protein [Burkholderiaceae bacterium]
MKPSEPDLSHAELFGHLADTPFTTREAAEYLEVSMSTLRRHVASGKLNPGGTLERNKLFAAPDLKRFKKTLRQAKI